LDSPSCSHKQAASFARRIGTYHFCGIALKPLYSRYTHKERVFAGILFQKTQREFVQIAQTCATGNQTYGFPLGGRLTARDQTETRNKRGNRTGEQCSPLQRGLRLCNPTGKPRYYDIMSYYLFSSGILDKNENI
jgi:hypothetical protein